MDTLKINIHLFIYFFLSILPTLILGLLKINTYTNYLIWISDVIIILLLSLYCIFHKFTLKKNSLLLSSIFMIIIIVQLFDYLVALSKNMISPLYMILPFTYFLHFFCIFNIIANIEVKNISFDSFFKLFLLFVVFSCFYNIFINFNNFNNILNFNNKYLGFSSFFNHRNGFGQLLFVGVVVNYYLLLKNKKSRLYFLSFLLIIINLLLSFSRTSIFVTCLFFVFNFVQNIFQSKNYKKIFFTAFIIIVLLLIICYVLNNDNIMRFLNYYVLRSEDGLSGRDNIWYLSLSRLRSFYIFTGYGIGTSSYILSEFNLTNAHNTIIELLLSGGIVLFSFYLLIYLIIIRRIKKIKDIMLKRIYISFFICFLTYTMFEKVILFSTGYAPLMFTIFICAIPSLLVRGVDDEKRRID